MSDLGAHFFRREYGRLVATLTRRFGLRHLEAVEDAVQEALLAAVDTWPTSAVPDHPSAWLYRAAYNHFIDGQRKRRRREAIDSLRAAERSEGASSEAQDDVGSDLLRLLFVCCDKSIPMESQLVFALKTLCGFDVREIAARLFMTEANVYKRLGRARRSLRELPIQDADPSVRELATRLPAVQSVLYLLFTEGHLSLHAEPALRRELCDEARRLTELLAMHPAGATPETFALLALMYLHTARMATRQDASGGLVLLEEQDRSRWDASLIEIGVSWLGRSASGDRFSRYHAEAGIAAEHCLAPSFAETRWDRIVECYALLDRTAPSPLHTLNRALAVAEWRGPEAGLATLEGLAPPSWLAGSFMWAAVLADLHRRAGDRVRSEEHRSAALAAAPNSVIRRTLERRLTS